MKTRFLPLLFLAACGARGTKNLNVAPDAREYFDSFQALRKQYTGRSNLPDNFTVEFGDTASHGQDVVGYCTVATNYRTIVLDRKYWDSAPEWDRLAVFAHEAGHCILNRQHKNGLIPGTARGISIMNSYVVSGRDLRDNYDYYMTELFSEVPKQAAEDSTLNAEEHEGLRKM